MDIEIQKNEQKKVGKTRVKVAIRVRPMIAKQIANNESSCVEFRGNQEIILAKERNYKFDYVFRDTTPQSQVYENCVKNLIMGCFEGYNAAILAYGQTGSGKTFTMGTSSITFNNNINQGIVPRVIEEIFAQVKQREKKSEFIIKASFLQIYNEQILDLLSDNMNKNNKNKDQLIAIREEKDGSVSILNVTEEPAKNAEQMMALLQRGGFHRTTATTLMNDASSRSHAIFTIFIEQHKIDDLYQKDSKPKPASDENDTGFMTAKFFFVDLAGSERVKKTGASGVTLKQGININLGLLELGNVISALSTIQKKQGQFITYRNSKLTRILQQCLGGNSNTYMIACISPAQSNFQQSLNTLKYASKAMNIKNKLIKNVDPHTAQISQLTQKIYELEVQNRKLKLLLNQKGVNVEEEMFHSADVINEEMKKLKKMYLLLEKRYEEISNQLKQQKKQKNKLEITQYQLKRQRDIALLRIESFKQQYPIQYTKCKDTNNQLQIEGQKLNILNELSQKIQYLTNEIKDKEKINAELQKQLQKQEENIKRDDKLLISKNTLLHQLYKQNERLQKIIANDKKNAENQSQNETSTTKVHNETVIHQIGHDDEHQHEQPASNQQIEDIYLDLPPELLENQQNFHALTCKTEQQLQFVDRKIIEREKDLQSMNANQLKLQYELIEQMKQQYHQKIMLLQKEKNNLMKQRDESVNTNDKSKYITKIDNLQNELKEFRKKIKQQKNLQKMIDTQNNKIKQLANEIKKFKIQKNELNKKLKDDKDSFNKFKMKKIKQIFYTKKQNIKKDFHIKKLILENNKFNQSFKKKQEELYKAKRINQTLKNLIKPNNNTQIHKKVDTSFKPTTHSRRQSQLCQSNKSVLSTSHHIPNEEYCQQHILKCIKKILAEIDQQMVIKKYQNKVKQLSQQIKNLLTGQSQYKLKLQKILVKEQSEDDPLTQEEESTKRQLQLNLNDLKQRIANAEESMTFCQQKYQQILQSNRNQIFDIDAEVIYQKMYEQAQALRIFIKAMFIVVRNILIDNYGLNEIKDHLQLDLTSAQQVIQQLKQKMQQTRVGYHQSLQQLRQQMMVRYYNSIEEQQAGTYNSFNIKRLEEKDRKNYQKKILDLTKSNRQISHEVQMLRRKCNVVQEKYQNIRSLLSKDKGIGRPINKQFDQISNKDKRIKRDAIQEINQMVNQLDSLKSQRFKRNTNLGQDSIKQKQLDRKQQQTDFQIPTNRWQCLGKIDAHNSAVLSIATHANMLISTSTKSLKIWDLETSKIISDLSGNYLTGLVKYVLVQPERNIMLTACDKIVTIWDLVTLNVQCTLKAHKDEVRTMYISNDILFTGGKGLTNSGSLLIWDLRNLDPNKPQQEKERNRDIFTFTSKQNILYYGTRNHHVRRMDLNNMEILAPFQPPHMDAVTGLAIVGDKMISGSKDKNLRLWSLDQSVGNLKNTTHAFNDYVTTVQSQNQQNLEEGSHYYPIFYAGSKDGQIKVGNVKDDKIDFLGTIMAHTQSVNAISLLEDSNTMVSASADKTIKLWKPSIQTMKNIQEVS